MSTSAFITNFAPSTAFFANLGCLPEPKIPPRIAPRELKSHIFLAFWSFCLAFLAFCEVLLALRPWSLAFWAHFVAFREIIWPFEHFAGLSALICGLSWNYLAFCWNCWPFAGLFHDSGLKSRVWLRICKKIFGLKLGWLFGILQLCAVNRDFGANLGLFKLSFSSI